MKNASSIINYILIALIVIVIAALGGWFLYLRSANQRINAADSARGAGQEAPNGALSGSTHTNIEGSGANNTDTIITPTNSGAGQADNTVSLQKSNTPGFFGSAMTNISNAFSRFTGNSPASNAGVSPNFSENSSASFGGAPVGAAPSSSAQASSTRTLSRLWRADKIPVAGYGYMQNSESIYFVERATGYIYTADPLTQIVSRRTNRLFPKVYEALFSKDGSVVLRSTDDGATATTFVATLGAATTTAGPTASIQALSGGYIDRGIDSIAINPTSRELFYLMRDPAQGEVGTRMDWIGTHPKKIFSSALSGWNTTWLENGKIIISQRSVDGLPSYAYEVGNDGTLKTVLRNIPGLSLLPHPTATMMLYSSSTGRSIELYSRNTATTTGDRLPIRTIAEKCAWAPGVNLIAYCAVPRGETGQNFLNTWFKGILHTSDEIWRVDVSAGTAKLFYTPVAATGVALDIQDPKIDPSGNYLSFINAADQSLWMLRLAP